MRFVGLDGFRKGWVAVSIDGHARSIEFLDSLDRLSDKPFRRAAIDIPIGLPPDGNRGCDEAVRTLIAPHGSRVFLGARRWILECRTLAEANREARRRGQKGVSAQLFCLMPKIAEADRLVRRLGQEKIWETHPELVFWRLNGNAPLPSKKTPQGHAMRRRLLERDGFEELDTWLDSRIGTSAKPDDVLDACACAVAARDGRYKVPTERVRTDRCCLKMTICY